MIIKRMIALTTSVIIAATALGTSIASAYNNTYNHRNQSYEHNEILNEMAFTGKGTTTKASTSCGVGGSVSRYVEASISRLYYYTSEVLYQSTDSLTTSFSGVIVSIGRNPATNYYSYVHEGLLKPGANIGFIIDSYSIRVDQR